MSRTITAMFDSRTDAEAGRQRLIDARVDANHVHIHDQSSAGDSSRGYSTGREPGMWGSIKNAFLPDEDRHTYEEGLRRGGYLLTADVDEDEIDDAVRALEDANTVDIDERAGQWRSQGWDYPAGVTGGAGAIGGGLHAEQYDRDYIAGSDTGATARGDDRGEQRLDVIEEELVVGKREVERGGVRVRSYVTERPIHEQVRLRDENISVERRPVDRDINDAGDAFRERTIEMTETDEEAVVGKKARVIEEVVVRKTAEERVEDINETVRRTDVDVENLSGSERGGTTGTSGGLFSDDRDTTTGGAGLGSGLKGSDRY